MKYDFNNLVEFSSDEPASSINELIDSLMSDKIDTLCVTMLSTIDIVLCKILSDKISDIDTDEDELKNILFRHHGIILDSSVKFRHNENKVDISLLHLITKNRVVINIDFKDMLIHFYMNDELVFTHDLRLVF